MAIKSKSDALPLAPSQLVETGWVNKDYGLKVWIGEVSRHGVNEPPATSRVTLQGYRSSTFNEDGVLPSEWTVDLKRAELVGLLQYAERIG